MARTKQTCRKSTGGKAPRKSCEPVYDVEEEKQPLSDTTNTYISDTSGFRAIEVPCSPNRATFTNPFSQPGASPIKIVSHLHSVQEVDERDADENNSFRFATSVEDFLNPGQDIAESEPFYSTPSASFYQTSIPSQPTPYQSHTSYAQPSFSEPKSNYSDYNGPNNFASNRIKLPNNSSISMGNFFNTAAGRAFRTATRPQRPMSDLQLLVYTLHSKNRITREERGILKDAILRGELQDVLEAYHVSNNEDRLVNDFKKFCGNASSAPSGQPSVVVFPTHTVHLHGPRAEASPSAAKTSTSKVLLLLAKLFNMNKLSSTEKATLKDKIIAGEGRSTWESALSSFESNKDYDNLASQLKMLCNSSSASSYSFSPAPSVSKAKKSTAEMLLLVAKLFGAQKITANDRSQLKDKIVSGETAELESAVRIYESNQDQDSLAAAFLRVLRPEGHTASAFSFSSAPTQSSSWGSTSFGSSTQKSQWLDRCYKHVWKRIGDQNAVLFLDSPQGSVSKIACFDLDDTLVKTRSGKKFATAPSDYVLLFPEVNEKLRQLVNEGYKLVIFSNQLGIGTGKMPEQNVTGRINSLIDEIGVPIQAFCALEDDLYRKPSTKMWDLLIQYNGPVDLDQSFYVGDAAGRPADGLHPKDFSCSDRKFASNVGIKFYTPEEYFLGEAPRPFSWDTADLSTATKATEAFVGGLPLISSQQELVIFVGFPASGKSTFAKRHFVPAGYVHVNRDTLKTQSRCLTLTASSLDLGQSVVVDNTNPSASARKEYIDLARARGVAVRCFHFMTEESFSQHLNMYREKKEGVHHVPKIAYAMFKKQFEAPRKEEGFVEIKQISFVPEFENKEDEKMFYQHT